MNPRKPPGSQLPLPAPRSPQSLDDRILAHAQAHAPARERSDYRQWMSGLAAASIFGVAVLIALPTQHTPEHEPMYDAAPTVPAPVLAGAVQSEVPAQMKGTAIEREAAAAAQRSADVYKLEHWSGQGARLDADTVDKAAKDRQMAGEQKAVLNLKNEVNLKNEANLQDDVRPGIAANPEQAVNPTTAIKSKKEAATPLDPAPLPEAMMARASKRSSADAPSLTYAPVTQREQATVADRNESDARADKTASTSAAASFFAEQENQQALKKCLALLPAAPSEDSAAAKACYQSLRERCSKCELPATVQEAAAFSTADRVE